MKVISGQLRHSDPNFTASTYAHILPELAHTAVEATAAMVPRGRPQPTVPWPVTAHGGVVWSHAAPTA
jgi:hypothetical protein